MATKPFTTAPSATIRLTDVPEDADGGELLIDVEPLLERWEVGPEATVAEVLALGLNDAARLVVTNDAVIRRDDDIEGVHQARVGVRRARSLLRTFGPSLDPSWSGPLDQDLRCLAAALGRVRDLDVLALRLRAAVGALDSRRDQEVGGTVLALLAAQRAEALADLHDRMDAAGHDELLDRLAAAAAWPVFRLDEGRFADSPAAAVLPSLVRRRWRSLRREVRALPPDPPDAALHRVRIRAKRARYAAEASAAVQGKPARRFSAAAADLQDRLGVLNDAVVAEGWLRAAAPELEPAAAFVAGELAAVQQREARRRRRTWRPAWDALDRPRVTAWLR